MEENVITPFLVFGGYDGSFIVKKKFEWKSFYLKYRHAIPAIIYGIIYLTWFSYLEKTVTIPFCEVFVIPYFLWFAYIATVVVFFFFKDKEEYYKTCLFLATGMTIFLIVSTLWPNGQHLRPYVMPRDNIFTRMVAALYKTDTPTNLWPSIHVYNSLGVHIAVMKSRHLENKKGIRIGSFILCVSIILSTMFIKQHSVFDVTTAFIMAAVMYVLVYRFDLVCAIRRMFHPDRSRGPQVES